MNTLGRSPVTAVQLNQRADSRVFTPWRVELGRSHGQKVGLDRNVPIRLFTQSHIVRRGVT